MGEKSIASRESVVTNSVATSSAGTSRTVSRDLELRILNQEAPPKKSQFFIPDDVRPKSSLGDESEDEENWANFDPSLLRVNDKSTQNGKESTQLAMSDKPSHIKPVILKQQTNLSALSNSSDTYKKYFTGVDVLEIQVKEVRKSENPV